MYVVPDDWKKQIADTVSSNGINIKEEKLNVALENIYNKRGDLRSKFQELVFVKTKRAN
ncbi:MAG TPA: hypothetical protein VK073_03455 [Pseudogracilibacillus sp.]|nr:hypothetical protein [Pseudogracilibacillus sp.]